MSNDKTKFNNFNKAGRKCATKECEIIIIPNAPNHKYCKQCQIERAEARNEENKIKQRARTANKKESQGT